jgi:hypothetical protein
VFIRIQIYLFKLLFQNITSTSFVYYFFFLSENGNTERQTAGIREFSHFLCNYIYITWGAIREKTGDPENSVVKTLNYITKSREANES